MLLVSLIAAGSTFLSGLGYESVADAANDPQGLGDSTTELANAFLLRIVSYMAQWIATFAGTSILTGMLAATVSQLTIGKNLTIAEAWAMTRKRLGSLIGTFVLTGAITTVPIILWIIAVFGSLVTISGGDESLWWVVLVVILAIFPVMILVYFLQIKLLFAPICAVLEEIGPIDSLKRSWSLVKGEFWPTLGRVLLLNIVVTFIGGFLGFIIGIIGGIFVVAVSSDPTNPVAMAISTFFIMLGSSLLLPFSAAFETLIYTDLRIRKENFVAVLVQAGAQQQ